MIPKERFDEFYRGVPPWETGRPQKALVELFDANQVGGKVLDAGCGTGEHALELARRGLQVIGIDIAQAAIESARTKARERGLTVEFVCGDVLDLPSLGHRFDTVLDSGLYHVLDIPDAERYVKGVAQVLVSGGRLHLLCFSDQEAPGPGPRRLSQEEIREAFADGFRVDSIREARCENLIHEGGARGWLASLTRL